MTSSNWASSTYISISLSRFAKLAAHSFAHAVFMTHLLSAYRPTSVNNEWRTGCERCIITRQKQCDLGDLLRFGHPTQHRDAIDHFGIGGLALTDSLRHRGFNRTRTN